METKHHIYCGGLPPQATGADTTQLTLNLWQNRPKFNVRLTIEHLHKKLYKSIPAQFHDLLEIATYVACGVVVVRVILHDGQVGHVALLLFAGHVGYDRM